MKSFVPNILQGQVHTYHICGLGEVIQGLPASVTFSSQCAGLDLPDPRYLQMHAAAARIAHMSGAAACIDDILDDLDEGQTRVMSGDGLSAHLLDFSLMFLTGS